MVWSNQFPQTVWVTLTYWVLQYWLVWVLYEGWSEKVQRHISLRGKSLQTWWDQRYLLHVDETSTFDNSSGRQRKAHSIVGKKWWWWNELPYNYAFWYSLPRAKGNDFDLKKKSNFNRLKIMILRVQTWI